MTNTDIRCGTCRFFETRAIVTPGSQYGHCDWAASHLVDSGIPYWVLRGADRQIVHKSRTDCSAWEAPE